MKYQIFNCMHQPYQGIVISILPIDVLVTGFNKWRRGYNEASDQVVCENGDQAPLKANF